MTLPVSAARAALSAALAGRDLAQESSRAYAQGLETCRQLEAHRVSKEVQIRTLPGRKIGETTIVPIRWEATGVAGDLFPALDADLCLTPVNDVTCVLSLIGRYEPPFGRVGETLDRTLLSGTAQASVDTFVRGLSVALHEIATAPSAKAQLSPGPEGRANAHER